MIVFSTFMSLLSVSGIIKFATPILLTIYPIVIVLIVMTLFDKYIKYDISYTGPVLVAGVIGFIDAMNKTFGYFAGANELLMKLPLASYGFPWIAPAMILFALFAIAGKVFSGKSTRITQTIHE